MPTRTDSEVESILEAFKDLYIAMREKWISQNNDGLYSHMSAKAGKPYLNDNFIREHLRGKKTVGVFARSDYVKFLTFDVDVGDSAKEMTLKLIDSLLNEFQIRKENLLASYSGSKGFHITFFFDDTSVTEEKAKKFYNIIRLKLGATEKEIEFRPQFTVGVKFPLGINKKTGNHCHLVDIDKLEHVDDSIIFNVVKVDSEKFLDNLIEFEKLYDVQKLEQQVKKEKIKKDVKQKMDLSQVEEKQLEKVLESINVEIPVDYENRMAKMLEQNCLIYPDSRHESTYQLCIYLKEEFQLSQDVTEGIVRNLIFNTYETARHLISEDTRLKQALSEVSRLCNYVYVKDKKRDKQTTVKTIRIYQNELVEVLKSKKMTLMKLAFIMLLHSKKYVISKSRIFYMTYEQMADYGADSNGARVLKQLIKLEELEFLKIVERNRKRKNEKHLPNLYRVEVVPNEAANFIEFDVEDIESIEFEDIVVKLIPKKEIKKILTKDVFYENFNEFYKKTI
jgi:hypothetical protein